MPLEPSDLPHHRKKLTLLYLPCQENSHKTFFPSGQTSTEDSYFWQTAVILCKHLTRALAYLHHVPLECRSTSLLVHSNYEFSPYTSGLIVLNYQIWLKMSALKWHCDTSDQQEHGRRSPKYINIFNREFLRQVLLERNRLLEITVNCK